MKTKKLVFTALCIAIGIVLPMAFHAIPNAGSIFFAHAHSRTDLWFGLWMALWSGLRRDGSFTFQPDYQYAANGRLAWNAI